jgi:phosphatidate cytidylyltransferase
MKQRIITALICLPFVILVLFCPTWVVTLAVMAASLVGLYEYHKAVGMLEKKPLCLMGYLACLLLPFGAWLSMGMIRTLIYLYIAVLFGVYLMQHKTTHWSNLALLVMGLVYIPYFLSHIIYIRELDLGRFYIWLVFIGAFMTDTCAYFVGCGIGKTKLCPNISPKKTVAGAVGGIVGCGICFLIYGIVVNSFFASSLGGGHFSLIRLFDMGLICAVLSEMGDLVASLIKRQYQIKDFGNLLPGHGGILDRCDSIILVAPMPFLFLQQVGILVR